jgi:Leucine-rich repeat (LRR) protein
LYDLYLAALDGYVGELTKADKIELARRAQAVRDEVATKKAALLGDPAAVTSAHATAIPAPKSSPQPSPAPATAAGASTIPPEALAPPQKAKRTRELIEWVMQRQGFRIGYTQGNNRFQVGNSDRREIPSSANIWLIDIGNQGRADGFDPSLLEGQTDLEQLQLFQLQQFKSPLVLRGMKKLQTLRITGNPQMLDEEAMRFFPPLPSLTLLEIHGAFSNEGLRIICERCPKLENVVFNQRFVEGGLSLLTRLKGLRRAAFTQGEVAGPDIAALGDLPSLQGLHFSIGCKIAGPPDLSKLTGLLELTVENAGLTDAEVKTITVLKKLTNLNLSANTGITDAAIPQLATLPKLTQLRMRACGLKGLGGATMPVFPALELCHIHGNSELDDAACAGLAKQKTLKSIFISESKVADTGLQLLCDNLRHLTELNVSGSKVTDAGMMALRRAERLQKLWLDGTSITDASIESLRKLSALTELYIRRTNLTPQAIATLEKTLPRCKVYSE